MLAEANGAVPRPNPTSSRAALSGKNSDGPRLPIRLQCRRLQGTGRRRARDRARI